MFFFVVFIDKLYVGWYTSMFLIKKVSIIYFYIFYLYIYMIIHKIKRKQQFLLFIDAYYWIFCGFMFRLDNFAYFQNIWDDYESIIPDQVTGFCCFWVKSHCTHPNVILIEINALFWAPSRARAALHIQVTLTDVSHCETFFFTIKNHIYICDYWQNSNQIWWFLIAVAESLGFGNKILIWVRYHIATTFNTIKTNNFGAKKAATDNTSLFK